MQIDHHAGKSPFHLIHETFDKRWYSASVAMTMKCDYTGFGTWCISTPKVSVWVQINCSPEEGDSLTTVFSAFMDSGDRNVFLESWDSSISMMQNNTGWSLADYCSYLAGLGFFFFLFSLGKTTRQTQDYYIPDITLSTEKMPKYLISLHSLLSYWICKNKHFIPYHEVHSGYFLAELRYKRLLLKHLLTAQRVQNWEWMIKGISKYKCKVRCQENNTQSK